MTATQKIELAVALVSLTVWGIVWLAQKPCLGCMAGWPVRTWGGGHKGHNRPGDGQLVECHSLRPVTMAEDTKNG